MKRRRVVDDDDGDAAVIDCSPQQQQHHNHQWAGDGDGVSAMATATPAKRAKLTDVENDSIHLDLCASVPGAAVGPAVPVVSNSSSSHSAPPPIFATPSSLLQTSTSSPQQQQQQRRRRRNPTSGRARRRSSQAGTSASSSSSSDAASSPRPAVVRSFEEGDYEHLPVVTRLRRIHGSTQQRLHLRDAFIQIMRSIPQTCTVTIQWSNVLQPERYLGGGSYGHVYAFRSRELALPFQVAIKAIYTSRQRLSEEEQEQSALLDGAAAAAALSPVPPPPCSRGRGLLEVPDDVATRMHETDFDTAMLEIQAQKLVSQFVESRVCPHFPLFVRDAYEQVPAGAGRRSVTSSARRERETQYNMRTVHLVMEMCDESLNMWCVRRRRMPRPVLSMLFQVSMAICWMHMTHGMVHNDLYARNIMCNHVDRRLVHRYRVGSHTCFDVPLCGYLWKVMDFSLATSPSVLRRLHTAEFNVGGRPTFANAGEFVQCVDPSNTYNFAAYSRDLLCLLWSVVRQNEDHTGTVPPNIINWCLYGIEYVAQLLSLPTGTSLHDSPVELVRTVIHLFSPETLVMYHIPPNIFAPHTDLKDGEIPTFVLAS